MTLPGERIVGLRDEITQELSEAAVMDGVADIPTTWLGFCAHMVARWPGIPRHVGAEWQKYYSRERGYQSTTRAREARIAEESKARLAKTRQGQQDAGYTPPPVSTEPEIVLQPHDIARLRRGGWTG